MAEEAKEAAEDVKDGAKNAVQDAEDAFREQANKATSQKGVVEGTVREPLAQGRPATDPNNAWYDSTYIMDMVMSFEVMYVPDQHPRANRCVLGRGLFVCGCW